MILATLCNKPSNYTLHQQKLVDPLLIGSDVVLVSGGVHSLVGHPWLLDGPPPGAGGGQVLEHAGGVVGEGARQVRGHRVAPEEIVVQRRAGVYSLAGVYHQQLVN